MKFRFPWVWPNQRIVPKDFLRLAEMVEDLVAHVAQGFFIDPADATINKTGVVLWGLKVTNTTDVGGPKVTIAPGLALAPETGGERKWRLVPLLSEYTVNLAYPGAGTRTDTIQIGLAADADALDINSVEQREFRRVNADGAQEVYQDGVKTYRIPTGVPSANANTLDANPAASAGAVRLAAIKLDTDSVVSLTDWRKFMWAPPVAWGAAWDSTAYEAGTYYRSARQAYNRLAAAVAQVLTIDGKLRTVVSINDGGADLNFSNAAGNALMQLGTRALTTLKTVSARLFVLDPSSDDSYSNDHATLDVGRLCRASINVRVERDGGGSITACEWTGFGVEKVVDFGTPGAGVFEVYFDSAIFDDAPDLTSQRYQPLAWQTPYDANRDTPPDADDPIWCRTVGYAPDSGVANKGRRLLVYVSAWDTTAAADAGDVVTYAVGFSVRLYGPLGVPDEGAWTACVP